MSRISGVLGGSPPWARRSAWWSSGHPRCRTGAVRPARPARPRPVPRDPAGLDPTGHRADSARGRSCAPPILEAADANKDGRLSPEEAARAAGRFVRDADREKKGSIDLDNLRAAINRRVGPPPGADDGPGGGPPGGFGPGMFLGPRILELADANKDGRLRPMRPPRPPSDSSPRRTATRRGRSTRRAWPRP